MTNSFIVITSLLILSAIFAVCENGTIPPTEYPITEEDIDKVLFSYCQSSPVINLRYNRCSFNVNVSANSNPLFKASVKVILTPKNFSSNETAVSLYDDEDIVGVYHGYFNRCTRPDLYDIKVIVNTTELTCVVKGGFSCDSTPEGLHRSFEFGSVRILANRQSLAGDFVNDLTVTIIENNKAVVKWTDTWDKDTVDTLSICYLPLYSPVRNLALWKECTILSDVEVSSKNSSRSQVVDLSSTTERVFTIALLADDGCGNMEMSNPVMAEIYPITTTTSKPMTHPVSELSSMADDTTSMSDPTSIPVPETTDGVIHRWLKAIYVFPNYINIQFQD